MATAAVTYTFAPSTTILSAEANTNFSDLVSFLNTEVMHRDASSAFTAVPSGPATNPSSDNHLSRKKYVDDTISAAITAAKVGKWGHNGSYTPLAGSTLNPQSYQLLFLGDEDIQFTDSSGEVNITFATPFPNALLSVVITQSDKFDSAKHLQIGSFGLSGFDFKAKNAAGTTYGAGTTVQYVWFAIGC